VASVLLVGVAMYAHSRLEETPAFTHLQRLAAEREASGVVTRSPVLEVLRTSWRRVLLAGGAFTVVNTTFYIYITFLQDYGVRILHMSRSTVLLAIAIVALIQIPALAGFAAISDRIGRRKMYLAGSIGTAIWAFPLFWLVDTGTGWGMTLGLLGGQVTLSMMYGPLAAFFSEMFSAEFRYSGASLGYQLGALLGGAISSVVAAWLFAEFHSNVPISLYIIAVSLIAIACVLALTETYQHDMDDAGETINSA
jgi:MFS family permease